VPGPASEQLLAPFQQIQWIRGLFNVRAERGGYPSWRGKLKATSRLNALEARLSVLESKLAETLTREGSGRPITTFEPEPFEVLREIKAVVQKVDEDEFIATFFDANVSAAGCNQLEAVENLKGILLSRFEFLDDLPPKKLGPGPAKQIAVFALVP